MQTFRRAAAAAGLCVSLSVVAFPLVAGADSWGSPSTIDTNLVVGPPQSVGPSSWFSPPPTVTSATAPPSGSAPQSGFAAPSFGGRGAPQVTENPSNVSVAAGASASFSAAASGSPAPSVQWEESTSSTGSFSPISGATSDTYSFVTTSAENGYRFEAVFTNSHGSATSRSATLTVTSPAPSGPTTVESSNWSGYADTGTSFTSVSGDWTVPAVTCSSATTYSAQWVGIDGYSSDTVEQDGTSANCSGDKASYSAWYEMYGDTKVDGGDEVELSTGAYPVSSGDAMSASVSVASSTWTLTITDTSSAHANWTYTATVAFSGAQESSAEWVVERPEVCSGNSCSLTTLSNFGSVTFQSATTSRGTISTNSPTAIEMVNGTTVIAQPGALSSSGNSFTDTYE